MEVIARTECRNTNIRQPDFQPSIPEFGFDDICMNVAYILATPDTYAGVRTYAVLTRPIAFLFDEALIKAFNRLCEQISAMGWHLERIIRQFQDSPFVGIHVDKGLFRLILRNWAGSCSCLYKSPLPVYACSLLPPPWIP